MKQEVELVAAHLKKDLPPTSAIAVMDFTSLHAAEVDWLLHGKIISLPVLVRNLIALKQNGIREIYLQYGPDQEAIREVLQNHPFLKNSLFFFQIEKGKSSNADLLQRIVENGSYWVNPHFLINGIFLHTFEAAKQEHAGQGIFQNAQSGSNLYWLSSGSMKQFLSKNGMPISSYVQSQPKNDLSWLDPKAYGHEIRSKKDVRKAEKLLCEDVTRKKGGILAKIVNEPISLWIAKQCAKTPIHPNTITLFNTVLGVLSAYLVYQGGKVGSYGFLAAGAILFYLVDIFDGIDGELARFTFRLSKHGALYDTISDNITLLAFLTACIYAAYKQVQHGWVIATGFFTVFISIAAVLYLLYFTMKHFGNASLRLYEARFLPMVPRENKMVRFIHGVKHIYTKDVLAALISAALLINLPILIVIFAPLIVMQMFVGFIYLGLRYGHLLKRI